MTARSVIGDHNGRKSAYPAEVADLVPRARELAEQIGRVPSRNLVMKELKIGAPKAMAVIDALSAPDTTEADMPDPDPAGYAETPPATPEPEPSPQEAADGHPDAPTPVRRSRRPVAWPVLLLALPAFVAIWSGWVGLGELAGFGVVTPLPGIADDFQLNTAITLPIGMEAYASYALWVWLSNRAPVRARRFARWSALLALVVGAAGQVAYHLLAEAGVSAAPWPVVVAVSCLPVAVLGMGAALAHLLHAGTEVAS